MVALHLFSYAMCNESKIISIGGSLAKFKLDMDSKHQLLDLNTISLTSKLSSLIEPLGVQGFYYFPNVTKTIFN
jgi:hypothetical protein